MSETQLATNATGVALSAAAEKFELLQRQAKLYASSTIVPKQFQGNLGNCAIAIEMAVRLNADPMAVMQQMYVVHGTPSWSAQFIIAAINQSGRFSPLQFRLTGEGDGRACVAYATDLSTGEMVEGPEVSLSMAKAEKWGPKWQTMPEVMLRYRSATFFGRNYVPDVLMGMRTQDEVEDIRQVEGREVPTGMLQIEAPKKLGSSGLSGYVSAENPGTSATAASTTRTTRQSLMVLFESELDRLAMSKDEAMELAAEEGISSNPGMTVGKLRNNQLAELVDLLKRGASADADEEGK